jgi:hypothetical protein
MVVATAFDMVPFRDMFHLYVADLVNVYHSLYMNNERPLGPAPRSSGGEEEKAEPSAATPAPQVWPCMPPTFSHYTVPSAQASTSKRFDRTAALGDDFANHLPMGVSHHQRE